MAIIDSGKLDELRELLAPEGEGAFERFLAVYLSSSERAVSDLRAAVAGADGAEVERRAHALKGSAGNVGAGRFADACRRLEESARQGRNDWDFAAAEEEYARVRAFLEPLARTARPQEAGR